VERALLAKSTIRVIVDLLIKGKILPNPPYQRQLVWTDNERRFLLDSIARDYDIGKFYLREVKGQAYEYEVIDGQQRLQTLQKLIKGELTFPETSGHELAGKKLEELSSDKQIEIGSYVLDILIIKNADDFTVRDMFRRLQLGKRLTTGERMKAYYGKLHDFVEKQVLQDKLFSGLLGFKNTRDIYFEVASQMLLLSIQGQPFKIRYDTLLKMYDDFKDKLDEPKITQFQKDLSFYRKVLEECEGKCHPDKANSLGLFLFSFNLKRGYYVLPTQVANFIKSFEEARYSATPNDEELNQYHTYLLQGTASKKSLQYRFDLLTKRFLTENPSLQPLDDKRLLRADQRMAVYYRDKGKCTVCGKDLPDNDFQIHHNQAWSNGGPTTVQNSSTVCTSCHKTLKSQ